MPVVGYFMVTDQVMSVAPLPAVMKRVDGREAFGLAVKMCFRRGGAGGSVPSS